MSSLSGKVNSQIPCFPCAVATLDVFKMEFQQKLKCTLLCSDASRISKVVLDEPMILEMGATFQNTGLMTFVSYDSFKCRISPTLNHGHLAVCNCKSCGYIQYFMDKLKAAPWMHSKVSIKNKLLFSLFRKPF